MKKQDYFNIELPKWPAMAVSGKRVTQEQAAEIIIRTQSFWFSTNDWEFRKEMIEACGCTMIEDHPNVSFEDMDKLREKYQCLPLNYLTNARIISSWIGGPYGWIDWNGNVFSNNYNIGKWPSVESVYNEWKTIAEAFPYLELKCQLFAGETCENDKHEKPLIQFSIKNGKVRMSIPKNSFQVVYDASYSFITPFRERGCTLDMFKDALKTTEESLKKTA